MNTLSALSQLAIIILIIVIYCGVLIKLKHRVNKLRDWVLLPITAIGGFVLYFIGYTTGCPNTDGVGMTFIKIMQSTMQMLFMQIDINGINQELRKSILYMTSFIIIHALAILLVVTTAISLFGRRLNARIKLLVGFNKKCYIFFKTNDHTITLGENLLKNNPKRLVIFIGEKASKNDMSMFDRVEEIGGYYIDNNHSNNKVGGKLLFNHITRCSSNLFFISSDEDENVSSVLHLFSLVKQLSPKRIKLAEQNINLHIRIESEGINQIFEEARKAESLNLNYCVFSDAEIIATQVINQYNPLKYLKVDSSKALVTEDFEVMIIGFGDKGSTILRKLIEYGQFVGSTFRAKIVDKSITTKIGSFNANYPEILNNYQIETIEDYVGSLTFFETLKKNSSTLKQIIISLGSDAQNVKTAIEIEKMLKILHRAEIDIIIITRKDESYSYIDRSNDLQAIHCVGRNKDIFSEEIIVNETLSTQAEATHNFYNLAKAPNKQKPWRKLENVKQQSNISASNHITTKLKLMGLTVDQLKHMSSNKEFLNYLKSNPERYENLAQTEHLRWNASYYIRGWQKWNLKDIDGDTNQNHSHKLHACLVDWNDLDAVSKRFNEPYKQYDFDNIDKIYELVKNDLFNNN